MGDVLLSNLLYELRADQGAPYPAFAAHTTFVSFDLSFVGEHGTRDFEDGIPAHFKQHAQTYYNTYIRPLLIEGEDLVDPVELVFMSEAAVRSARRSFLDALISFQYEDDLIRSTMDDYVEELEFCCGNERFTLIDDYDEFHCNLLVFYPLYVQPYVDDKNDYFRVISVAFEENKPKQKKLKELL